MSSCTSRPLDNLSSTKSQNSSMSLGAVDAAARRRSIPSVSAVARSSTSPSV